MMAKLPRIIIIQKNAFLKIGKVCEDLNLSEFGFIICDKITKKIAGDKITKVLSNSGVKSAQFIINDATKEEVKKAVEIIKEGKFSFVLGIGGGKPIDVAKMSSFNCSLPFISIPTAASHDGIASSNASIKINKVNVSIKAEPPIAIIADTKILASAPYKLFASGCGDIISNLTAIEDWKLANRIKNESIHIPALKLSELSVKILIKNIDDIMKRKEKSINVLLESLILSGIAMNFVNSSRPISGSEHKFSHALDRISLHPALHGEQCALGSIMMMCLHKKDWKKIRILLKKIGLPTTAKEIGIPSSDIVKALTLSSSIRPDRYTIIDKGITEQKAEELARKTFVID